MLRPTLPPTLPSLLPLPHSFEEEEDAGRAYDVAALVVLGAREAANFGEEEARKAARQQRFEALVQRCTEWAEDKGLKPTVP
jgi:hypothetical protein